jgi:serine/threonine protein kinase
MVLDVEDVYSAQLQDKQVQLLELIGVGSCCSVYKGLLLPCIGPSTAAPPGKHEFVAVKLYHVPSGKPTARASLQMSTDMELWFLRRKLQPVDDPPRTVQLHGTGILHVDSTGNSSSNAGGSSVSGGDSSSSSNSFKYAVLELGQSLATGLNSMGPAPLENIKSVIWYLLHAVSDLHYYDADFMVIHRDLKPDNILLVPHAHAKHLKVKLMDFNAIAAVHRSQSGSSISGSSSSGGGKDRSSQELPPNLQCGGTASLPLFTMIGSELYMAPEVSARFDAYGAGGAAAAATLPGYDEKVDVYALGVIAMVMVAGGEGRLRELMVPPAGVGRKQHMAGLVSRFAAGQLLVGNMTAENMHMYDGLRQFVGVCCTHDPAQRPSIADLKRKQVPPVSAWLHKLE